MNLLYVENCRQKVLPSTSVLVQQLRFKGQRKQRYRVPPPPKEKTVFVSRKRSALLTNLLKCLIVFWGGVGVGVGFNSLISSWYSWAVFTYNLLECTSVYFVMCSIITFWSGAQFFMQKNCHFQWLSFALSTASWHSGWARYRKWSTADFIYWFVVSLAQEIDLLMLSTWCLDSVKFSVNVLYVVYLFIYYVIVH